MEITPGSPEWQKREMDKLKARLARHDAVVAMELEAKNRAFNAMIEADEKQLMDLVSAMGLRGVERDWTVENFIEECGATTTRRTKPGRRPPYRKPAEVMAETAARDVWRRRREIVERWERRARCWGETAHIRAEMAR